MGRKVVFLGVVAAGLVQVAPLWAQAQDVPIRDRPQGEDSPAAAAPVDAQRAVAPASAAAAPGEVRDKARELAERDLAAVPPEELNPVLVDPGEARRARARARQAAAEADAQPRDVAAPRPMVADAVPPPPAAPVRATAPVYADDDREPGYLDDDNVERTRAEGTRRRDAASGSAVYAGREPEAASAQGDALDDGAPTVRDLRGRQARQAQADEAVAPPLPARDLRERQARQVHAGDAADNGVEATAPSLPRDLPARAPRAVYADDDDRDARGAYPGDRRDPAAGIDDRVPRPGERYAIVDRDLRPDTGRDDAPRPAWGNRTADSACDADRAARLRDNVRRKADFERIDSRAAEDIEEEIGHAANLQRSYCATGMNDWRGQRLDRLYAQIEDRIRYEEDRRWQR